MSETESDRPIRSRAAVLGVELSFLLVFVNVVFAIAEGIQWWNLVVIAVAARYGLALTIGLYRVPAED